MISRRYLAGIGYMLLSGVFLALAALLTKLLVISMNVPLLLFSRFFIAAIILWWIVLISPPRKFKIENLKLHFIRALFVVLSQYAFYYYLTKSSLLNATLLYMTGPLFVPLISRVIDKIPIKPKIWVSLIIGFSGVICLLNPIGFVFNWFVILGLLAGFLNACSQITFHRLSHSADIDTQILIMYSLATLISAVPLLSISFYIPWHQILRHLDDARYFILLIALAVVAVSTQTLRAKAYSKVNKAMSLSPFLYIVILLTGIIDWLVFGIKPDLWSYIGAGLIIVSGLIIFIKINGKTGDKAL
jgi:drug/metabolite transporter (DMT)-like permease